MKKEYKVIGFIFLAFLSCAVMLYFIAPYAWRDTERRFSRNDHSRTAIRKSAIRYIQTANENRWGTFVDARDTLYMDGELCVFDTINLVYKRVATVTIHELK